LETGWLASRFPGAGWKPADWSILISFQDTGSYCNTTADRVSISISPSTRT